MNTKLKCLVLDDELPGLSYLRMLCSQIPDVEVVRAYNNPLQLLEDIPLLEFDCCIMDIEMPQMDGLQLAHLLKGKQVIFTTAYKEYAAEAFDLDAADYIRKPIQKERLEKAIGKVRERLRKTPANTGYIHLNSERGKARIPIETIVCISGALTDPRDKLLLFNHGEQLVVKNTSFPAFLEKLPPHLFCRVNKSTIIALKAVRFFTQDEIRVSTNEGGDKTMVVTLGENYRAGFLQMMHQ